MSAIKGDLFKSLSTAYVKAYPLKSKEKNEAEAITFWNISKEDFKGATKFKEHIEKQIMFLMSKVPKSTGKTLLKYFAKDISDPTKAIVQHQVGGNEARMLVLLENGEQRLVTFDICEEDCTVADLLEQANIQILQNPLVTLVADRALGINYIVNTVKKTPIQREVVSTIATSSADSAMLTAPVAQQSVSPRKPKYITGMLAVCTFCGMSASDFNYCMRCKRKLPEDVNSIPENVSTSTPTKKDMALPDDHSSLSTAPSYNHQPSANIELVQFLNFKPVLEKEKKRRRNQESEDEDVSNDENEVPNTITKRFKKLDSAEEYYDSYNYDEDEIASPVKTIPIKPRSPLKSSENLVLPEPENVVDEPGVELSSERLQEFSKLMIKMFEDGRIDTLTLQNINEQVNANIPNPFAADEIDAALKKLADDNKIMVADKDNIILI